MATYPTPSSSSDMSSPDVHDSPVEGAVSGDQQSDHEAEGNVDNVDETEREVGQDDASGSDKSSNSDSGGNSEHKPGDPSYDMLREWWDKTNGCGDDLNAISKRLSKIKIARTVNWKRELKGVITNVDKVLRLRDEVKDALGDDDGSSSAGSGDESFEMITCHPKLTYVPWKWVDSWSYRSYSYSAIEIPSDKAPDPFFEIVSVSRPSWRPRRPDEELETPAPRRRPAVIMNYDGPLLPPPDELPNRIRINSIRLQRLLNEERRAIGDSIGQEDVVDDESRLILFKPFKMLYYLEARIRARLCGFEEARNTKFGPQSEEEYIAAYDDDPVSDEYRESIRLPPLLQHPMATMNRLTAWINDCRCLVEFMDRFLVPERTRVADAVSAASSLQFSELWHAFPVGSLVYLKDESITQKVWKVDYTFFGRPPSDFAGGLQMGDRAPPRPAIFYIDCHYLEFDGNRYKPIPGRFQIQHWEGFQAFSSVFPLVPLAVAAKDDTLENADKEKLVARGRRYIEYALKPRHLYYTGRSQSLIGTKHFSKGRNNASEDTSIQTIQYSVRVDSPIMVDFARGFQEVPWWRPEPAAVNSANMDRHIILFTRLAAAQGNPRPGTGHPSMANPNPAPGPSPEDTSTGLSSTVYVDVDQLWDRRIRDDFLEYESKKWRKWEGGSPPSDEFDIALLPPRVIAFVFRARKWASLGLGENKDGSESLTEIVARAEPWTDLKLPDGHKEVVQSLITWHFNPNKALNPHFDLVRDKGKGVIILLHGVPGVGKTSTAECAAESNGRPLFPITCGDLGLTPLDVESKLDEIFRLAQAWGCILLLDEADVFLAQRTTSDIQRNALVSVFLRTLEHYEGILFLTTNRVGVFDEAFKSRIHISLYYPSLDQIQTYEIWQTHIAKAIAAGIHIDKQELINFAVTTYEIQKKPQSGPVWNGRQIRNAFQSALALAGFHANEGDALKLERRHFQKVFTASDKFSNYIWRVRQGHSDADWNKMSMTRRDDFAYASPPGLDAMNNTIVPQGPYGGFPGGQTAFNGGGSFPQSTFGQNFGVQQGVQPQMPGIFEAANQFQQFGQPQYQHPSAAGQAQPTGNLGPQQQQQQAVPSQAPTMPPQYNPIQTGQFGQNTMLQQTTMPQQNTIPQHNTTPLQQNTFQQDTNYALFAQQQKYLADIALQSGIHLQPNQQAANPAQQSTIGTQQAGTGFMTPEAAAAAQQQAAGNMQMSLVQGQQGTGMGAGL